MGDTLSPTAGAELGRPDGSATWVVAVGSSAGGIEALTSFLRGLDEVKGVAIIVAQHLAPSPSSSLSEILSRETRLTVADVSDGEAVTAGVVHVTPPGVDIAVVDGAMMLTPVGEAGAPRPSIDGLMRSVAREWADHGVGVVLSGTGTDGTEGIDAIKAGGGVTIAQDPLTAKFPAMPQSAIATGSVDLVASRGS